MRFADVPAPPVPAYQNVAEFGLLWQMVADRQPQRVLEIGSLYGGTLWWWSHLPGLRQLVTVDLVTDWDQIRPDVIDARPQWAGWCSHLDFHELCADSHDPATLDAVRGRLDGPLDFAFIDGDHSYDGVRSDFELWSPLVRPGGLVAFHDTIRNGDRWEPGVEQFTRELRWSHTTAEFFDPDGVGIMAVVV